VDGWTIGQSGIRKKGRRRGGLRNEGGKEKGREDEETDQGRMVRKRME